MIYFMKTQLYRKLPIASSSLGLKWIGCSATPMQLLRLIDIGEMICQSSRSGFLRQICLIFPLRLYSIACILGEFVVLGGGIWVGWDRKLFKHEYADIRQSNCHPCLKPY